MQWADPIQSHPSGYVSPSLTVKMGRRGRGLFVKGRGQTCYPEGTLLLRVPEGCCAEGGSMAYAADVLYKERCGRFAAYLKTICTEDIGCIPLMTYHSKHNALLQYSLTLHDFTTTEAEANKEAHPEFFRFLCIALSRAFTLKEGVVSIIPGIDMMNHCDTPNVHLSVEMEGNDVVYVARAGVHGVVGGEELVFTYGVISPPALLHDYGVVAGVDAVGLHSGAPLLRAAMKAEGIEENDNVFHAPKHPLSSRSVLYVAEADFEGLVQGVEGRGKGGGDGPSLLKCILHSLSAVKRNMEKVRRLRGKGKGKGGKGRLVWPVLVSELVGLKRLGAMVWRRRRRRGVR